jgi:hypothetical protein
LGLDEPEVPKEIKPDEPEKRPGANVIKLFTAVNEFS